MVKSQENSIKILLGFKDCQVASLQTHQTSRQEALWQLKDRSFSQVKREPGVGYGTLRRLLEREIDEECLGFIDEEDEVFPGSDKHSFRHQELVYTVPEVKKRKVLGILRSDSIATF